MQGSNLDREKVETLKDVNDKAEDQARTQEKKKTIESCS